jgi:hypothetical protein
MPAGKLRQPVKHVTRWINDFEYKENALKSFQSQQLYSITDEIFYFYYVSSDIQRGASHFPLFFSSYDSTTWY